MDQVFLGNQYFCGKTADRDEGGQKHLHQMVWCLHPGDDSSPEGFGQLRANTVAASSLSQISCLSLNVLDAALGLHAHPPLSVVYQSRKKMHV